MPLESLNKLVAAMRKLPSVGTKTATRYAYGVIEMTDDEAKNLAEAILEAKSGVRLCSKCGNYCEGDVCDICATRLPTTICVVGAPRDIIAFEKMGGYDGVYHVLHGTIDFQRGRGADDIRIKELVDRLDGSVKEVIIATNADVSGELTASYIAKLLKPLGVKVTRLAYGISIGSEIEFADEMTLQRALADRRTV